VSLRTRLTLAGAGAVFAALGVASSVIYLDVRSNLHGQVDVSLLRSADDIALKWAAANRALKLPSTTKAASVKPGRLFGKVPPGGLFQIIPSLRSGTNGGQPKPFVPLLSRDESVANGLSPPYFRDVRFAGQAMRLYTMHLPSSSDGLLRITV
jgi:hypothetical protein